MIERIDESGSCVSGPSNVAAHEAADLESFRSGIRRFAGTFAALPVETEATCPRCRRVVPATFERVEEGRAPGKTCAAEAGRPVVLRFDCPACGSQRQVHHDAIWTDLAGDLPGSAAETFSGARVHPVLRGLPRTVETLCPECAAAIVGRYFVEDGAVHIEKSCPEHGYCRDMVNSDALLYSKAAWWTFEEPRGHERPQRRGEGVCPADCGLCGQHLSGSVLAQIDLTNRCNMRCPVCFANAGAAGRVVEPSFEQIVGQMQVLRDFRPVPCTSVQFTGGEPTIHPDFLRVVRQARDMGFSHVQIATNGIRMAEPGFAAAAAEAGLHTLYLQFDGVGEEAHRATRAYPGIWEKKLACLENCRKLDLKVCLVPTVVGGVNSDQVGDIFRFAVENIDTVSAISYQPVAFTGRIDHERRAAERYTLGHLAHDIAAASGASALRDMYPLSTVAPLSRMLAAVTGNPKITPSCHPGCAFGTYFLVSPEGEAYPFPRVIDVEGMFWEMNRIAAGIERRGAAGRIGWLDKVRILRMFRRHFRRRAAPPGLTVERFVRSLQGLVDKGAGRGEGGKHTYKTLLCAGMHFQDRYNFDVERAKRCVILYSAEEGVFPFCTWNCGPEYRRVAERRMAADGRRQLRQAMERPAADVVESGP
jgi:hypothetical protein